MSEIFHAPEGALQNNTGLLTGTVIQELRMRPFIDTGLGKCQWNYRPEYQEFTVLSAQRESYRCRYSGAEDMFWWPVWKEQPRYGFMDDGCTPVRYYVKEEPLPPPYEGKPSFSPYGLRCAEIDDAAQLLRRPDAFAAAASEPDISRRDAGVFLERPSRKFLERGGCPFYLGALLSGHISNILYGAVGPQLHGYVEVKFCEEGRKAYCPIWRAKNGRQIVSESDTSKEAWAADMKWRKLMGAPATKNKTRKESFQ